MSKYHIYWILGLGGIGVLFWIIFKNKKLKSTQFAGWIFYAVNLQILRVMNIKKKKELQYFKIKNCKNE